MTPEEIEQEATRLLSSIDKLDVDLDQILNDPDIDRQLRAYEGVEIHNRVERVKEDLGRLITQMQASGQTSAKVDEVKTRLLAVTRRLLRQIFNIKIPAAEEIDLQDEISG